MQFKNGKGPSKFRILRALIKYQRGQMMEHFDFQLLSNDGMLTGDVIKIGTIAGVVLACPYAMDNKDIEHLCRLAMKTPNYPHDLCHWEGTDPNPWLKWSARIHYRSSNHATAG